MCGIAGLWNFPLDEAELESSLGQMVRAMRHRGPDSQGFAIDKGWGFGQARLAIIDLTGGNQPIWTQDRVCAIVGNNEIYNAPELREELEKKGHLFSTHSDTEVALHGWREWGEGLFSRLNGMFAFAIYDRSRNCCVLARDPMGIKPLHWTRIGDGIAFASEIKALLTVKGVAREPNWDSAHLFMNFRYLPDDRTLFRGVERLPPGSFAILEKRSMKVSRYFSINDRAKRSDEPLAETASKCEAILKRAVHRHLLSDVEVGAYLSGGIDSSTVCALAAREKIALRSYCLAFGEPTDENSDAQKVASFIHSKHEDIHIGDEPLDSLAEVIWHVEEPKVNCLQGFALSKRVARDLKVVLSGLGGDELFAGYTNNDILLPMAVISRYCQKKSQLNLSFLQRHLSRVRGDLYFRALELGMNLTDPVSYYAILRNAFDHNRSLLEALYGSYPKHWENMAAESLRPYFDADNPDVLNALLALEARTKLINDFLLTEDRVSMAHSLEVRVPLLDKELIQFAFALPSHEKYRFGQKKRLLREVAKRWLPPEALDKKKWGFSVNPYLLFQKQLREFAKRELTETRVKDLGVFSWKWISQVLELPPSPQMRWHYFNLWVMAGFSIWHRLFFEGGASGRQS